MKRRWLKTIIIVVFMVSALVMIGCRETCRVCNGSGILIGWDGPHDRWTCLPCNGSGKVRR